MAKTVWESPPEPEDPRWRESSPDINTPKGKPVSPSRSAPLSAFGVVRLADVADHLPVVNIICTRCDRHGKFRTAGLTDKYGATTPIETVLRAIAANCPRMQANRKADPCGVGILDLANL